MSASARRVWVNSSVRPVSCDGPQDVERMPPAHSPAGGLDGTFRVFNNVASLAVKSVVAK
jgi:hypothetical protein